MTDLYPSPSNLTDFVKFLNFTTSNICADVSNPATCGSYIFFDGILAVFFLVLLVGFKQRHSLKEAYAGASVIVAFVSVIVFAMGYSFLRSYDMIFWVANSFISMMMLFLAKD